MSDVVDVEATDDSVLDAEDSTEVAGGQISIDVTDQSVKYDSNLTLPEVVFWMDVVRNMIMKKVLDE